MELKLCVIVLFLKTAYRFNCTFMELKYRNGIYYQLIISVIHHKWLKRLP